MTRSPSFRCFLIFTLVVAQLPLVLRAERVEPVSADRLSVLLDLLESVDKQTPKDSFDPAAVVKKLAPAGEIDKLLAFVRDQTHLVPYRGSLRGSRGVLMERLGNSLDRSMLLGELLRLTGRKVRLVNATLSAEQAREILSGAKPLDKDSAARGREASLRRMTEIFLAQADKAGMDVAKLRKGLQTRQRQSNEVAKHIGARVAKQAADLASAVGAPGGAAAPADDNALEALRDHWWVQVHDGKKWTDLDVTLPPAREGQRMAEPETAIEVKADAAIEDSLPDKHHHQVNVRVVIEQWTDGALKEHEALSYTLIPSKVIDQPVVLIQGPTKWPKGAKGLLNDAPLSEVKPTLIGQSEWLPELVVGDRRYAKLAFDDRGNVLAWPKKKRSPFDILAQKVDKPAKRAKGHLTAEWIDYQIISPGRAARTIRREVFDLLGPAARQAHQKELVKSSGTEASKIPAPEITDEARFERALALTDRIEILAVPCRLSPEFLQHLMAKSLLANREALVTLAKASQAGEAAGKLTKPLVPLPGHVYALAAVRAQWGRDDVYIDSPNVLTFHRRLTPSKRGRLVACQGGFDIVANDVAVRPGQGTDRFGVRLAQGVLDTNAEAVLLPKCVTVTNAAALFEASRNRQVEWVTLRKAEDLALIDAPDDVKARIRQDIAGGCAVLAPKKAMMAGKGQTGIAWWRVDPKTGQTLGIGPRGWGSSEYPILTGSSRTRGEGHVEYLIILALIMVCAVVPAIDWVSDTVFGPANSISQSMTNFKICIDTGPGDDSRLERERREREDE